jgi:hypothetical protein
MKKIDMQVTPKTVYSDIVTMPDPMLLGLTINYHNYSDSTLYMQVSSITSGSWAGSTVNLGSLGSGSNAYINLDNFASRSKPASAVTEILTVTLRGYTDAGYSNLLYTFTRDVTIILIKSDDGSWTQDFLNNFNDGTVQGWQALGEGVYQPTLAVATDYVLSTPYSLKMSVRGSEIIACRLYKTFATPNKTNVYAIINVRSAMQYSSYYNTLISLTIKQNDTQLIFIGRLIQVVSVDNYPRNKWMRLVVPLTPNATVEVRIIKTCHHYSTQDTWLWMDDFKIISK